MSVRQVLRMGHPQLMKPSQDIIDFSSPSLKEWIQDMKDTMEAEGGVGIAAPQIGEFVNIILFGFEHSERYPNAPAIPFTILINPCFSPVGDQMVQDWEGCLSVPGLRGLVPRYQQINYTAKDVNGNVLQGEATGFHARVIQHECDHLQGILYPSRIQDFQYFGFEGVLAIK